MNLITRIVTNTVLVASLVSLSACASLGSSRDKGTRCELSGTQKLELAVSEAQEKLESGCTREFSGYYNRLLQLGAGFPKPENAAVYQDFLRWSVNQGIISRVQAGERYDRYFSSKFSGLSDSRSVASAVCPNLDGTLADLRSELADKETGLQGILGQANRFQEATRLYYNLQLNLSAICAAVEGG